MLPRISKVQCQDADYLLFCTDDIITNTLFRHGIWEDHLLKISKIFVDNIEAPLIIDIGANLGAYSIPLAKYIKGYDGTVMGFEPQRIVYYQLCGNIILNRLDNYYAINSAIGNVNGVIEIPEVNYADSNNVGAFSLEKKYRQFHGIEKSMLDSCHKVQITTLDDLNVHKAPSLIKIDVEGFELNVLMGGSNFLASNSYPPIIFEAWSFDWYQKDKNQLLSFILNMGYRITPIGETDFIAQHPHNPVEIDFYRNSTGNTEMRRIR
jgi:FkbM family methyltransferase